MFNLQINNNQLHSLNLNLILLDSLQIICIGYCW